MYNLYLNLLKKCLTNVIFWEHERSIGGLPPEDRPVEFEEIYRGLMAYSMIGYQRMSNLEECCVSCINCNIPGDFVETGVWRGGACIFMAGILKAYKIKNRSVWVCDCFKGVPAPEARDHNFDISIYPQLAVSLAQVEENFKRFDLYTDQVKFLEGYFKDTLPTAPIDQIAVLRLDGDLYSSTMDVLSNLYDKVSDGGYIIVDDYCLDVCKWAIRDFREGRNIQDRIMTIDGSGVYWQKGSN
jgi:hypothetical protein